jgi:GDPmannose 4,6-dehydratase
VSGQDGAYLAQLHLDKGYEVYGTSRYGTTASLTNLDRLGIRDRVQVIQMTPTDARSVQQAIARVEPDEIYNLAGQSSVSLSFEQPIETLVSIAIGTHNLLEALRAMGLPARLFNACSGECFGETPEPADETTPFRPKSPYGVAKTAAFWEVVTYREAYRLYACSGILFPHESPLRPERFVTKKIVAAARRIAAGSNEKLRLGNLAVVRDWGWAPEYVEAMWRMLQQESPDDCVIATGESHSLEEFVLDVFSRLGLEWKKHVIQDESLLRPTDILVSRANPGKASRRLGWKARLRLPEVVEGMLGAKYAADTAYRETR